MATHPTSSTRLGGLSQGTELSIISIKAIETAELVNGGTPRRMAAHHGMNRSVWTTQAIIFPFFPLEFSEANGGIAVRDEKNTIEWRWWA